MIVSLLSLQGRASENAEVVVQLGAAAANQSGRSLRALSMCNIVPISVAAVLMPRALG